MAIALGQIRDLLLPGLMDVTGEYKDLPNFYGQRNQFARFSLYGWCMQRNDAWVHKGESRQRSTNQNPFPGHAPIATVQIF